MRASRAGTSRVGRGQVFVAVITGFIVLTALLVYLVPRAGADSTSAAAPGASSYSDNGMTCSMSAGTPKFIESVVPEVVQSHKFLALANGMPYAYSYYSNESAGSEGWGGTEVNGVMVGGTTVSLPPAVELGFYSPGAGTSCNVGTMNATSLILVTIPVQGGSLNMSGATYQLSPPHY